MHQSKSNSLLLLNPNHVSHIKLSPLFPAALLQFESRKIHATRRVRGSNGRFVPKDIAEAARRQVESALAASAVDSTVGVGGVGGVTGAVAAHPSGSAFTGFPFLAGAGLLPSFGLGGTSAAGMAVPFGHLVGVGGGGSSAMVGASTSSSSSSISRAVSSSSGITDGGDALLTLRHPPQVQQPRQPAMQSPPLPPQSMLNALQMLQGAASQSSGVRVPIGGSIGTGGSNSSSSSSSSSSSIAAHKPAQAFAAAAASILHRE